MKTIRNLSPLQVIILGSLGVALACFFSLFVIDVSIFHVPNYFYLVVPVVTGIISFLLFYLIVKRFVNERLQVLYRTIRRSKMSNRKEMKFKISGNTLKKAERDTLRKSVHNKKEIKKLQEQAKFRREFMGNLAHELKTPIFSIQGYLLTLIEGGLEDSEVNMKFLSRASKATDRMVHLIEDLDLLIKLDVNELPLELVSYNITEQVKDIIEMLESDAKEKNITLKFDKAYDDIFVYGDVKRMSQVFINLIRNSISYGNQNGTTEIRFYAIDGLVTIEVADNGPGIDKDSLNRIFERFYRVEKSRSRNEGGSGLGLAIVKHIIESHKQSIHVRSTIHVGTTFVFTLDQADK